MKEKSVFLNKNEIIKFCKEKYNLDVQNVSEIKRGSANLYLLNKKYVLKEYQSKYKSDSIRKEIDVINFLYKSNIKVPKILISNNNKHYIKYKNRIVIIQKYIDGYIIDQCSGDYNQVIESAKFLGRIVKELEKYPKKLPTSNISEWYSIETLVKGKNKLQELIKNLNEKDEYYCKIKNDLEYKISIINKFLKHDFADLKELTFKNTHGDYSMMQFIYKNNKIAAVIDFASAGKYPITWEIARSYSYIDKEAVSGCFNINNFVDYVKEFCRYVKLNKYDKKNIGLLYLLQLLPSSYGYKQYIADNSNVELLNFAFFRTNICRYLFNNYKLIGKKMMEEL